MNAQTRREQGVKSSPGTTLRRFTASAGILFFVVTLAAIGVTASTGLTEQALERGAVERVLPIAAANLGPVTAAMWLFNLSTIGMALFGVGLVATLDKDHPSVRFASPLVVLGAAALLLCCMGEPGRAGWVGLS